MLNYTQIIEFLKTDKYIDKTMCFGYLFYPGYHTLCNCAGTGSSFFLKTLACFLDKNIDTKGVFGKLQVSGLDFFEREINRYQVLYLDFSDFDANGYEKTLEYVTHKMSDIYKYIYDCVDVDDYRYREVLDIIAETANNDDLANSLHLLLNILNHNRNARLAVLIDNLVQLEIVAQQNGYSEKMDDFLRQFAVEDIYKYCDYFLQIGDESEETEYYSKRITYTYFSAQIHDLKGDFGDIIVDAGKQYKFNYTPLVHDSKDWTNIIAKGRKEIERQEFKKEQLHRKSVEEEKRRYAIDLSDQIPKLSPNFGIRGKTFDKASRKYSELTDLLKMLYNRFLPSFDHYDVYRYFQKIDENNRIVRDCNEFAKSLKKLSEGNSYWTESLANVNSGYWVQVYYIRKEDNEKILPNRPKNIKVYAYIKRSDIQTIFMDSLRYMLENAKNNFAAKIATCNRSDQMCYWISADDFKHLEGFYRQYVNDMVESLPFVAYKSKLGISREFQDVDSHNAMQALIISDYLKNVQSADSIDLADMYNNYIKKWNADIYEDGKDGCKFKYQSVLSFITILDTLDCLLGKTRISNKSLLMSGNAELWNVLAKSLCWADVNENWNKNGCEL